MIVITPNGQRTKMKMNRLYLILAVLILMSSCTQNKHTEIKGWSLVYKNDLNGAKISGDKEKLRKALESGCEVRVSWAFKLSNNQEIMHVTEAAFLSVYFDEVFAQTESIVRQIPEREGPIINLDTLDNRKWYSIIGTTGEMRSTFSGTQKNNIRKVEASWFINEKNCLTN